MPSFIYNLNKREFSPYNPDPSVGKLIGSAVLQGMGYTALESVVSNVALTGLGAKIVFDKKPLAVGWLNKLINHVMTTKHLPKSIRLKKGDEYITAYDIINKLTGKQIPEISHRDLDMGWFGYSNEIHSSYKYLIGNLEQMGLPEKRLVEYIKRNEQLIKKGKKTKLLKVMVDGEYKWLTFNEAKTLLKQRKWAIAWHGVANFLQQTQIYSMTGLAIDIGKTLFIDLPMQTIDRKKRLRYYRRLSGISGGVSNIPKHELSYSRQEEQLIIKSIKQTMVTKQLLNDQGVFGTNPYLSIYG